MKIAGYLFLVIIIAISSCSEDEPQAITPEWVNTTMEVGDWIVVGYFDDNVNETGKFNGYTFGFNINGNLAVVTPDTTYNGSWIAREEMDDNDNDTELEITFNTGDAVLDELSDDWNVAYIEENKIELSDEVNDLLPDDEDVLVFQKK
ncbi:MAG: hypothetical protein HKN92_00075 [Chitinophagales bacterium]|nr:hypothetical protein [Chitinophagales bacterium]